MTCALDGVASWSNQPIHCLLFLLVLLSWTLLTWLIVYFVQLQTVLPSWPRNYERSHEQPIQCAKLGVSRPSIELKTARANHVL